jgi:hypothetical protein
MNKYFKDLLSKRKLNWTVAIFFMVIALSIFLRTYHFSDWLFMKGDQVRDAILTERSFNGGPGNLPLLGPKAGGTKLHLGPVFYYFQYASAFIFRSAEPPVLAFPSLLFSILTIPLLYFFSRKFFSRNDSMLITGLFSFCYLMIEYSRFAWNPNSTPFFNLLFIFSLFNIFNGEEKRRYKWFIWAGVSYSVASQLHFSSFLALPIIVLIFLFFNIIRIKECISWKNLLVFMSVVILFYVPVIVSDIVTHGDNVHQFLSSVGDKSSDRSLWKNISKDFYYFGRNFTRILTGYFGSNHTYHYAGEIFILISLATTAALFKKEKDKSKKQFIIIVLATLISYFILYIPLASSIDKPRFFLPMIVIPFVFLGFIKQYLFSKKVNILNFMFFLIIAIVFFWNIFYTLAWFSELGKSEISAVDQKNTIILKMKGDPAWWTWFHFQKAADFIRNDCKGKEIIYISAKNVRDLSKSTEFALTEQGDGRPIYDFSVHAVMDTRNCYYYFLRTGDKPNPKNMEDFIIEDERKIGSMTVIKMSPKENAEGLNKGGGATDQVVESGVDDEQLDDTTTEDLKVPRVYWNDIFK